MSRGADLGIERSEWAAVWRHKKLWVLHLVGNALLLGLAYAWLSIPDQRAWQLVASALLALAVIASVLWLHGGTLNFFQQFHGGREARAWPAFQAALRRLPAFALWGFIFFLILWLIAWGEDYVWDASAWLASWLTMTLRTPISPRSIARPISAIVWFVRWFFAPLALFSLALRVSSEGFSAFRAKRLRHAWRLFGRLRSWLTYAVLFLIGAYIPYRLFFWVPRLEGLTWEATTMTLRLVVAYALAVSAWLILLSALGRLGRLFGAKE